MFLLRRIITFSMIAALCGTSTTPASKDSFILSTDSYTFISQHIFTDADSSFGKMYCVPVAVANAFAMISNNHTSPLTQARLLASPDFMQTDASYGTLISNALNGIALYTQQYVAEEFELKFQGLSSDKIKYLTGPKPEVTFLREHLGPRKALWAQIGFYQYNPYLGTYRRQGGHFVSVLGYEAKAPSHFKMVIHDPLENYQDTHRSTLNLQALKKDERFIDYKGWERGRSKGFWRVANFSSVPPGTIPIIDGVIGLKLARPQNIALSAPTDISALP